MESATRGRNDPCPCGSKKKYKACCWDKDRAKRFESLPARPAAAPAPAPAPADGKPAKPSGGRGFWAEIKDRHPGKKR